MTKIDSQLSFILQSIKPFRWIILAMAGICLVWAADMSLSPYLLKIIVDRIQGNASYTNLGWPAFGMVMFSVSTVILYRFWDYCWISLNPPLKRHLGQILMDRMMQHSHQLYQDNFAGSLGNKIKEVMSGVPDLIRCCVDRFLPYTLTVIFAIITVWTVNTRFAFLLVVWIIFFISVSMFFSQKGSRLSAQASEKRSGVVGLIVDILTNMSNVRLFASRHWEKQNLKKDLDEYVKADQTRDWNMLKMFAVLGGSWAVYEATTLWFLIDGFQKGVVTAGDFVLILNIGMGLVHCMWDLSRVFGEFSEFHGQVSQGLKIILQPIGIKDRSDAKNLKITKGEIVFENVTFSYSKVDPIFHQKSVVIQPGQKIGLVGYSGSGKSTFVNLILRLFDVNQGRILIDGQDIQSVTQNSLHSAIGMIPQDPVLFHRSLFENIAYGQMGASDEMIFSAAKSAHADEFIQNLPEKYHTLVGERGIKLSGGQRQRIAIARTFLKNAPILILDEATSQLDSVTENKIQESLEKLMLGKTTIVVAHRLSTLLKMDRILVFRQGKIVEDGSHESLLNQKGIYSTMWSAQVGGFLPE